MGWDGMPVCWPGREAALMAEVVAQRAPAGTAAGHDAGRGSWSGGPVCWGCWQRCCAGGNGEANAARLVRL